MNKNAVILFLTILFLSILLIFFFRSPFFVSFVPKMKSGKNMNSCSAVYKKSADNPGVLFEEVRASTGGSDRREFRLDMFVATKDKKTARIMVREKDMAYARIAEGMRRFGTGDVQSPKGKEYLKGGLKRELEKTFGAGNIDSVYFQNFVYE